MQISRLYSSKSGARRIFSASSVEVPPGDFDIYTAQQLHESLSRLICDHPHVKKWLLKIDSTRGGRGIAYLDVERFVVVVCVLCFRFNIFKLGMLGCTF